MCAQLGINLKIHFHCYQNLYFVHISQREHCKSIHTHVITVNFLSVFVCSPELYRASGKFEVLDRMLPKFSQLERCLCMSSTVVTGMAKLSQKPINYLLCVYILSAVFCVIL